MLSAQTNGATMIFGKPQFTSGCHKSIMCAKFGDSCLSPFSSIMRMHIGPKRRAKRQTDGQF